MRRRILTAPPSVLAVVVLVASCGGNGGGAGGVVVACGNGQVEGAEECDDGNAVACDGCSVNCLLEPGHVCGDGILNQLCGEQCDDGNTIPGDGCDGSCRPEGLLLAISGTYGVDVQIERDSCFSSSGSESSPMSIDELDAAHADVDIPVGGAGGECDPRTFARDNNTLTLIESSDQQIGACTLRVDVTTILTFFDDDSVTGVELDRLSEVGGDCSGLTLPCEIQLMLTGARCVGCFDCVPSALGSGRLRWGPLGSGAGLRSGIGGE
jgi:cysteine-rich repeat protein